MIAQATQEQASSSSQQSAACQRPLQPWMCGFGERGAKSKRTGRPCRAAALSNGRCKNHGGLSLRGENHPAYRTGAYARQRALPERLAERFQDAVADPDLLSARSDVALLELRIVEIVGRLQSGESGQLWKRLADQWAELQFASQTKDTEGFQSALDGLGRIIRAGAHEEQVWAELADAIENKARTAERESRRLVQLRQVLTIESAMALVTGLTDAVRMEVGDPAIRQRIGERLEKLLRISEQIDVEHTDARDEVRDTLHNAGTSHAASSPIASHAADAATASDVVAADLNDTAPPVASVEQIHAQDSTP